MTKAIGKMNKKELIEKIKQLEQEKHEDKERFIGAGQIIKELQEKKDEHFDMLKKSSEMLDETVEFLKAVRLFPIFLKCMGDTNNRINLKELKDAINSIKCPECEKGKCGNCEKEKE